MSSSTRASSLLGAKAGKFSPSLGVNRNKRTTIAHCLLINEVPEVNRYLIEVRRLLYSCIWISSGATHNPERTARFPIFPIRSVILHPA